MSDNRVLQQAAKGAGLIFVGMLLTYIIKFIYRIIVSRYLGPSNYGLLSLGEGVLNVALLCSLIGLQHGVTKLIAQYIGEKRKEKIKGVILSVFRIVIPLSILVSIAMWVSSNYLGTYIFDNKELNLILKIFAATLPFFALSSILTSIFLAFRKLHYRNYLNAIIRPFSLLFLTIIIILFSGNVYHIAGAIMLSYILPTIAGAYLLQVKTFSIFKSKIKAVYNDKYLLSFSLPLFFSGIFVVILGWMDTFFLGALKTTAEVGIYNVALPLVSMLIVFIAAFEHIFLPISSELSAKKERLQIAKLYSTVSRWMFLLTVPVLWIVLIFSKDILRILFGPAYEPGAIALQILIIAYFIKAALGPASKTLLAFNKTKLLFYINSTAAIINLVLNYILISKFGILGAALATSISLFFRDIVTFLVARKKLRFSYSISIYFKYLVSAIAPLSIILLITRHLSITALTLIGIIILYLIFFFVFLIIFQAFTKEDLMIIEAIERKTNIPLRLLKKLMKITK